MEKSKRNSADKNADSQKTIGRRKALGTLAGLGGVAATQTTWVSPVIERVILPAHAETSGSFSVEVAVNEVDESDFSQTYNEGDYTVQFGGDDAGIDDSSMQPRAFVNPGEDVNLDTTHVGDQSSAFDFVSSNAELPSDETVAADGGGTATFALLDADDGVRSDASQTITWRFAKSGSADKVGRSIEILYFLLNSVFEDTKILFFQIQDKVFPLIKNGEGNLNLFDFDPDGLLRRFL